MTEEQEAIKAGLLNTPSQKYPDKFPSTTRLHDLVHDLPRYQATTVVATLVVDDTTHPSVLSLFSALCEKIFSLAQEKAAVINNSHELQCVIEKTFDQKVGVVLDNELWLRKDAERKAKKAAEVAAREDLRPEAADLQKVIDKEKANG